MLTILTIFRDKNVIKIKNICLNIIKIKNISLKISESLKCNICNIFI